MKETLEKFMKLPYVIEVVPELCTDGTSCYRSSHPELAGCMSHGDTPDEAIQNLVEAKRLYIQTLLEIGEPVPYPKAKGPGPEMRILSIISQAGSSKMPKNKIMLKPQDEKAQGNPVVSSLV